MAKKPAKVPAKDESDQEARKSGGLIPGIAAVAAASVLSSFATGFFLASDQPTATLAECPVEAGAAVVSVPLATQDQYYVELREILLTIGSPPAERYVKLKLAIVTDRANAEAVSRSEAMLVDAFSNYIRAVEVEDLESPEFFHELRGQLNRRAELVLGNGVVEGVLITEFLLR